MVSVKRSPLLTFGTALVLSSFAFLLTLTMPVVTGSPFLLFIVAIVISTRFGGLGPGLFATLLATLTSLYFFLPPIGVFGIASFVLIALLIVTLILDGEFRGQTMRFALGSSAEWSLKEG